MIKRGFWLAFLLAAIAAACLPLACASAETRIAAGTYNSLDILDDSYIAAGDAVTLQDGWIDLNSWTLRVCHNATLASRSNLPLVFMDAGNIRNAGTISSDQSIRVMGVAPLYNAGVIDAPSLALVANEPIYNAGTLPSALYGDYKLYDLTLEAFGTTGGAPAPDTSSIETVNGTVTIRKAYALSVPNATSSVKLTAKPNNDNYTVTFWLEDSTGVYQRVQPSGIGVSGDIPLAVGQATRVQARVATDEAGTPDRAIYEIVVFRQTTPPTLNFDCTPGNGQFILEGSVVGGDPNASWDLFILNAEDTPYDTNADTKALKSDATGSARSIRYTAPMADAAKSPGGAKAYAFFIRNHAIPASSFDWQSATTTATVSPIEAEWYFGNDPSVKYTWSLAEAIKAANASTASAGVTHIKLLSNVSIASTIHIHSGSGAVAIDLNGKTIDRGLKGVPTADGHVIYNEVNLTIEDSSGSNAGTITGGYADNGGGIYNSANGVLTILGGTIRECAASQSGGGVYSASVFDMRGGVITQCTAKQGGGIAMNAGNASQRLQLSGAEIKACSATVSGGVHVTGGTFAMTDGTVSGNVATAGCGGVLNEGGALALIGGEITANVGTTAGGVRSGNNNITIGNDFSISGNTLAGGRASNLYLAAGQYATISADQTKPVHITTATAPTATTPVTVAKRKDATVALPDASLFKSDQQYGSRRDAAGDVTFFLQTAPRLNYGILLTQEVQVGYAACSSPALVATGTPTPTLSATTDNPKLTWNAATQCIDVAAGLPAGSYTAVITATNGVDPDAVCNYKLVVASQPSIGGDAALTLTEGYAAQSTKPYTITGYPEPLVIKESGDDAITWNNATKTLDVAAGLSAGTYPVVLRATNETRTPARFTFTLTVVVPPTITGDVAKFLFEGYPAQSTEPYTIAGDPAPTVRKISGDSAITWNAATKTLDVAAGLTEGAYPVVLTATNGVAPDATLTFTLTVGVHMYIVAEPTDQRVTVGQRASFHVTMTGSGLHYQWYVDRNDGRGWKPVGTDSDAYATAEVTLANNGYRYYCEITDIQGDRLRTTVARLIVTQPVVPPKTGDGSRPLLWLALCALSLIAAAALRRTRGRRPLDS